MSEIESNCSENISNRDKLTALEQRKNDSATEQQIENATENRNTGTIPYEEAQKLESSLKRQRCQALAGKEQQEWELLDELAIYQNKYLQKFVQGKNSKDSILNENRVPTNISKPRKLDEFHKELLQEIMLKEN